jgi:ketopantoate reductase
MSEPSTVVIVGMGQLGGVFAEGLGRMNVRVVPVTRSDDPAAVAREHPTPTLALVTVAEKDFDDVLRTLPQSWKARVGLVQNELLPRDWAAHGIEDPTVAVVWFEKKAEHPLVVLRPTVVAGPARVLLTDALRVMDIDVRATEPGEPLTFELAAKNLYILTTNCAGLRTDGTVGELFGEHRAFALRVAHEVIDVQEALVGHRLDREDLLADLEAAVLADRSHRCRGRTAPERLTRLLAHARAQGVATPTLDALAADGGS